VTVDEWDTTASLEDLLAASGLTAGGRRLRLCGAACARRVAAAMPDDAARSLLDLAERRADGEVGDEAWLTAVAGTLDAYLGNEAARDGAGGATFGVLTNLPWADVEHTLKLAESVVEGRAYLAYAGGYPAGVGPHEWVRRATETEAAALCGLLRCVAGNPLRPARFEPAWRTATAVGLARGIYADRAFDRMPVLADALQDAGCHPGDVLDHFRGGGPHARGCWVVDLLLGKE
jgi:hypothetical protein